MPDVPPGGVCTPVGILGVPMDLGQDRRGVDMGPSAIRYARLSQVLEDLGYTVTDLGNVQTPVPETVEEEKGDSVGAIRGVCEEAAGRAARMVSDGLFPVFLGGDHSISIGTVSGVAGAAKDAGPTGVIWLDAHADFNTPDTSPSGNVHGMPLATLTGRGYADLVSIGGPAVRGGDVAIVGLRSVDREERELLVEAEVNVYTMKDVDAYGIASVMRGALEDLSHLDRVHLSFDLDVVDPEVAPGVGTPVRGGLTYREAHLVMELINEAGVVTSLDVVEINPILDAKNGTAELAVELVESLMGRQIIGLPE
ncbi:MAG: arginase [Actinobacteria bacterium]|nr:arginase [Actinomycetota bacterium]